MGVAGVAQSPFRFSVNWRSQIGKIFYLVEEIGVSWFEPGGSLVGVGYDLDAMEKRFFQEVWSMEAQGDVDPRKSLHYEWAMSQVFQALREFPEARAAVCAALAPILMEAENVSGS